MKWIKVTERLPEKPSGWSTKDYLVKHANGSKQVVMWYDGWNTSCDPFTKKVNRKHEITDVVAWVDMDEIED